ncbi:MAG: hypothetical protein KIS66_02025 [Fimbriimonadaceae bacterium]|nr:hypothetical protein [Fimbriimonadaceae bacterium]
MLFEPFRLPSGLELPNRVVVAPMTTYSSRPDGRIDPEELEYLARRARGGFGTVITAACYVSPTGHCFQGQWSCADDATLPSLTSAARAICEGGAVSVLQIHHGGRMCPDHLCGGRGTSASEVPAPRPNASTPRSLTNEEIEELIAAFASAAARAKSAGFHGVEIHGANTYLLQQFVSPHSNRRTDRWGQNRRLFPLRVTEAVLDAVGPGYPVGYRFSPEEAETPGLRWADTEDLVRALIELPLDWLHVSLPRYDRASLVGDFAEPTLARLARTIGRRVPLIGVGGVKTRADAEAVLALGADLVALGRVAISEPEWPIRVAEGLAPRLTIPCADAGSRLTIPTGLERRIYEVKGWFDVDDA